MNAVLGIDTGGTYTDAVLADHALNRVLASSKALTTPHDLSIGIGEAIGAVFDGANRSSGALSPEDVDLVGLSTTLATNAIAEGKGSPVRLLLIGYDPELMQQYGFHEELGTRDVVYLEGGHDVIGDEVAPLDEEAVREAILAGRNNVEAFAVSGYFSVRNPAQELRAKALVEELTGLPVTCGHELSSRLNAVRRATTVALNARLIPLLRKLIVTVRDTLKAMGIRAPLMVVKGDGSLVRAEWAQMRPVETILSGPAASAVGACHLAGLRDVWVVDVGGTTTDIAALLNGRPGLSPEGARVGGWQTMVEAVDVHTIGLGGDSHVQVDRKGEAVIGPRRVVPLCLLAEEHPEILRELRQQLAKPEKEHLAGQFVLARGRSDHTLSEEGLNLYSLLAAGPRSLVLIVDDFLYDRLAIRQIENLEIRGLVLRAGFTPTDALHVLGRFERWDSEASRLGAKILAGLSGLKLEEFCEQVVLKVSNQVTTELISKVLGQEGNLPDWGREPAAAALLNRALGKVPGSDLGCRLKLSKPVIAVGAPVEAYMPRVAEQLYTELLVPDHAEVANAFGAVAGGVVQRLRAIVQPLDTEQHFRLYLHDGVRDFSDVEEAVAHAREVVPDRLEILARLAGADHVEVQMTRRDRNVRAGGGWKKKIYLGTELTFTAVGRPSLDDEP